MTDGRTDRHMDGWMGRHVLFTCNCRRSVTHDRLKVPNLSAMDPFFSPDVFTFTPCPPCPVWINLAPPRGVSTYEILHFQTPLPGIRSGICIHAPTQYPPKFDFQQPERSWFLQLQRLRKGCSLFYFILFYFQMPRFGFCSPNIAPNPPPIFNMALKFLLNNTKTMTTAFLFF
jgi:hypothetical protein